MSVGTSTLPSVEQNGATAIAALNERSFLAPEQFRIALFHHAQRRGSAGGEPEQRDAPWIDERLPREECERTIGVGDT